MIVEARPVCSYITRQPAVAGAKLIDFVYQIYRAFHRRGTRIRTKVTGFVLFHLTRKQHPRIVLSQCHLDVRICLVITKHSIVLWCMLLYQIALQNKGLKFRVGNYILKMIYMLYHLFFLDALIVARLKVLMYSLRQAFGFADIYDYIIPVMHNINSRGIREFF